MKYRVLHRTTYRYAAPADACHNVLRLAPRALPGQTCIDHTIRIDPAPQSLHEYEDFFGNQVRSFALYAPHTELVIESDSHVEVTRPDVHQVESSEPWDKTLAVLRSARDEIRVDALQYVFDSPYIQASDRLARMARMAFFEKRPILAASFDLAKLIYQDFKFDSTATTIDTSIDDVLQRKRGVCQDFAHLAIGCLRSLGLACRYVSGYLRTDPAPGKPRLEGADASHAWISVYSTERGWVDFDPTNGCLAGQRHIVIGWGRDFHDISPVKGVVLGGGKSQLKVAVDVVPLQEQAAEQAAQ
jgi:transglutaminase-like putative cysteine protease